MYITFPTIFSDDVIENVSVMVSISGLESSVLISSLFEEVIQPINTIGAFDIKVMIQEIHTRISINIRKVFNH